MKKIQMKFLVSVFVMAAIICLNNRPVFADTVDSTESGWTSVNVYGYNYKYNSSVSATAGEVWASATIMCEDKMNLPIGYFGANSRLYNSAGTLVKSSGWSYNDNESFGMLKSSGRHYTDKGLFYSLGQVQMYNGNGYNTFTCSQSPYISARSGLRLEDIYHINDNEEVYGSEFLLNQFNIEPDLIEAIGDNGTLGYVKAADLEDNVPSTLQEVIEYQKNLPDQRTINLYENDGITVIDTFTVTYNSSEVAK